MSTACFYHIFNARPNHWAIMTSDGYWLNHSLHPSAQVNGERGGGGVGGEGVHGHDYQY